MSEPPDIAHGDALQRSGWLRAAVLGANDGIISTAALIAGVAASEASASVVLTAGIAGLVAGALSMAAGEYVSVSSQRDLEESLRSHEQRLTAGFPEVALTEVAIALQLRGIAPGLARIVAQQLAEVEPVDTGVRVKYGLYEATSARPLQAALTSAAAFAAGAVVPLAGIVIGEPAQRLALSVGLALLALAASGALAARLGGAPAWRGALRVVLGGGVAMALSALIGRAVGTIV